MVTLRDIHRAVSQAIQKASADTDEQPVLDVIDQYIGEQTGNNATSPLSPSQNDVIDKLSADLFQICKDTILNEPLASVASCAPSALKVQRQHYLILRFVRQLLPILQPRCIFATWFNPVLKPILSSPTYTNRVKEEAKTIVSSCLVMEEQNRDAEGSEPTFGKLIIEEYLAWTETYQKREQERLDSFENSLEKDETTVLRMQHQALLDSEHDEWSNSLVDILLSYSMEETKPFFTLLNSYFLSSKYRLQIVYLLSRFLLRKQTHLHEILETSLFNSLLKSLMYDNSTTLIAMSVTNLIMLLPLICTSLPSYLPQLFYIFARALCWDQLRDMRQKHGVQSPTEATRTIRTVADGWDCADYTFSKLSAPPSNPQTGPFFTALYGLYPCNFLKFLQKPYAYFAEMKFDIPEEFDEETFRSRTLLQVTRHMLHPNLVVMDAETELNDRSRWMKMEPPSVIAQTMSLDLTNAASRVAFSSASDYRRKQTFDSGLNWASTGVKDTTPINDTESVPDPDVHTKEQDIQVKPKSKSGMINDILDMHRALRSGAEVLVGDDIWDAELERVSSPTATSAAMEPGPFPDPVSLASSSPALQNAVASGQTTDAQEKTESGLAPETKLLIAALKREVLLLKNELNFELFLKQQHLQHIGRLHQAHIQDSLVEAERQETYNTTRMLRTQLEQVTTAMTQLKAESARTNQKHIKWENELLEKLRTLREARTNWTREAEQIKEKIAALEATNAEQATRLVEADKRVFELQNELKTHQTLFERATQSEQRVAQLTQQLLLREKDTMLLGQQEQYIKSLLSEKQGLESLVHSLQMENQKMRQQLVLNQEAQDDMKMQIENCESKMQQWKDVLESDINKHKPRTGELERLNRVVEELKQRLEALEMEKLEWQAEAEARAACTSGKTAENDVEYQELDPDDEEQTQQPGPDT